MADNAWARAVARGRSEAERIQRHKAALDQLDSVLGRIDRVGPNWFKAFDGIEAIKALERAARQVAETRPGTNPQEQDNGQ